MKDPNEPKANAGGRIKTAHACATTSLAVLFSAFYCLTMLGRLQAAAWLVRPLLGCITLLALVFSYRLFIAGASDKREAAVLALALLCEYWTWLAMDAYGYPWTWYFVLCGEAFRLLFLAGIFFFLAGRIGITPVLTLFLAKTLFFCFLYWWPLRAFSILLLPADIRPAYICWMALSTGQIALCCGIAHFRDKRDKASEASR